jgi:hypothetical protein
MVKGCAFNGALQGTPHQYLAQALALGTRPAVIRNWPRRLPGQARRFQEASRCDRLSL